MAKKLLFFILFVITSHVYSQYCDGDIGCRNERNQYPTSVYNPSGSGWSVVSYYMNAGNYTLFNVTAGNTYEWSYCTDFGGYQPWNAELTLLNYSNNQFLCYQNNSGRSNCPNAPYLSWTATFTGTVKLLTTQASCTQNTGSPYGTLVWKETASSGGGGGGNCISFYNGVTYDNEFINAANDLCSYGIIDPTFNVSHMFDWIQTKELALLIYKTLFPNNFSIANNYPHVFLDLENISNEHKNAMLAMLYLEYQKNGQADGISPISRDYSNTRASYAITNQNAMRMFFEAFNFNVDWSGYDKNNGGNTGFYYDVTYNNPNYGYLKTGYNNSLYVNTSSNCGGNYCCPTGLMTVRDAYVILNRFIDAMSNPRINPTSSDDYFQPNTFNQSSVSNPVGIERGIFSNYEDKSFNIPSGGIGLTFSHSYHSHYTEMPRMEREHFQNPILSQRYNPLGTSWTHSYNIYVQRIESNDLTQLKYYFWWADGTWDIYNVKTETWETNNGKYSTTIFYKRPTTYILHDSIILKTKDNVTYKFERNVNYEYFDLTQVSDKNGNSLTLSYELGNTLGISGANPPTRLKTIKDNSSNRSLEISYLPNSNRIDNIKDPINRRIWFNYDGNDDLTTFTDASGGKYTYSYGQNDYDKHLLLSITKPKGNVITNNYFKRKLKQTSTSNYSIKVDFNTSYTNTISTSSQITTTQNGQNTTEQIFHNSDGLPTSIQSNTSNTQIEYNDPINKSLATKITDNNTHIATYYQYDNMGNITMKQKVGGVGSSTTNIQNEYFEYDNFTNILTKYTDANGNVTNYGIDVKGNLMEIKYPNKTRIFFTRNNNGIISEIFLQDGKKINCSYNSYGNLIEYGFENSPIRHKATYDDVSRIQSITSPNGVVTRITYDNNDNVLQKTDNQNGVPEVTSHEYDKNDNLTKITDAENHATFLDYDFSTDDLIAENFGGKNRQWFYNSDGSIKNTRNKNGYVFNYNYHPNGHALEGMIKDMDDVHYEYNYGTKQLIDLSQGNNHLYFSQDLMMRTESVQYNDFPNNKVSYAYDNNNNIIRIDYPFGYKAYYEYDNMNRLKSIKDANNTTIVNYTYNNDNSLADINYANGAKNRHFYDKEGRLESIEIYKNATDLIGSYVYSMDSNGNHTSEIIKEPFFNVPVYDTSGGSLNVSYNYDYNKMTSANGVVFPYNNNGCITKIDETRSSFDERDNMKNFSRLGGINLEFEYDALENRRRKNDTLYVLDLLNGSNVLMEVDKNTNTVLAVYYHGLGLACRYTPATNTYSYYHYDSRGSTTMITDQNANITHKYRYGTFGDVAYQEERFPQPFKYVGRYGVQYDGRNLYFMRARYYNPYYGRFYSEDPIWSTNLYPYADNNPINRIDPSGNCPVCFVAVAEALPYIEFVLYWAGLGKFTYDVAKGNTESAADYAIGMHTASTIGVLGSANSLTKIETSATKGGFQLENSVAKVMGNSYKAMGEVTVPIKNTSLLNSLNATSKGSWVKVYEAGMQNGSKIEIHYFRNNTTGQIFKIETKYNYWHQKMFKSIRQ